MTVRLAFDHVGKSFPGVVALDDGVRPGGCEGRREERGRTDLREAAPAASRTAATGRLRADAVRRARLLVSRLSPRLLIPGLRLVPGLRPGHRRGSGRWHPPGGWGVEAGRFGADHLRVVRAWSLARQLVTAGAVRSLVGVRGAVGRLGHGTAPGLGSALTRAASVDALRGPLGSRE